jgi:hypothetical protein
MECARINASIEQVSLGIAFIVYGYDDLNEAHLFTLCEPDQPPFAVDSVCRDQDGIAVIGCGCAYAMPSLTQPPLPVNSQVEMLCRVCESKFEAENDPEVGADPAAGVIRKPSGTTAGASEAFLPLVALQAIRDAHSGKTDRPYPRALLEALADCIDSDITSERMSEAIRRAEQEIIAENRQRRGH